MRNGCQRWRQVGGKKPLERVSSGLQSYKDLSCSTESKLTTGRLQKAEQEPDEGCSRESEWKLWLVLEERELEVG